MAEKMDRSNTKRRIIQLAICVGLLAVIWGGYFLVKYYGADRVIEVKKNNFTWICQVDSVETKGDKVIIQGFAFEIDTDAKTKTYEIVLQDVDTEKTYFLDMQYEKREDVNRYFLCEYDYRQSGFVATIKDKKINLKEKKYEILLRVKGERTAFSIGTYLANGQVVYSNPDVFVPLDVLGTDLEKIVNNGILRVYRPEYGMYVYQYEGELYWIAEPEYAFVEGDTFLQFLLEPLHVSMLPAQRLDQWNWENISFKFSEYELTDWNTGKYRVAKKDFPKDYAIKRIVTGNYLNEEIWRDDFYPYYQLDN